MFIRQGFPATIESIICTEEVTYCTTCAVSAICSRRRRPTGKSGKIAGKHPFVPGVKLLRHKTGACEDAARKNRERPPAFYHAGRKSLLLVV